MKELWDFLEGVGEANLFKAIEELGLNEEETVANVKEVLAEFTRQWRKAKRKKSLTKLANSPLFEKVCLLRKCRDTPPRNPEQGGGLPHFFDLLDNPVPQGREYPKTDIGLKYQMQEYAVVNMIPKTYYDLMELRK